ncbi:unnamed protein product [Blumeria hordei]|uniref:AN1-type domain-containing protein n=2 Tax=Blumeria hordei TaxID=2867405 RepID=A0A383UHW5_BLUHO|nr:AN1-type zinc finger protein [Blumeria hordei DH14]SZE99421.1 unnamed protein product [Blumeria hordei]
MVTVKQSNLSEHKSGSSLENDDPTLVGVHCQYAACHQLDFLPFRCESCHQLFCLDHRTETNHKCSKSGEWASRRREANLSKTSHPSPPPSLRQVEKLCEFNTCKVTIGTSLSTAVHCSACNREYCLKHRIIEEHDCRNQVPLGARASSSKIIQTEQASAALSKLKAWGLAQRANVVRSLSKPKTSSAAINLAALNSLKKSAKGDLKIPVEKRVYLNVQAEAATTTSKFPSGAFFYSRDWVVGKLLDSAAQSLQVQNVNNHGLDETNKLRIFHVEGGRLLEFNEKIGNSLVNGNTVVLLRGIGPAVPDLIDLTAS